jgi:hypothetical protein
MSAYLDQYQDLTIDNKRTPAFSLYSARAVAIATFLGTPIAGAVLMAINYRRLNDRQAAASVLGFGLLLTAISITLALILPESFPGVAVWAPMLLIMQQLASRLQGDEVKECVRLGGVEGPLRHAVGIGLGFGVIILGVFVLIALGL